MIQKGHENHVEVIAIQVEALSDVLVLHLLPCHHLGADLLRLLGEAGDVLVEPLAELLGILLGEQDLVDNDVVRIDAEFGQLLDEALGLVDGKEFGDANADEGGDGGILEGVVDLVDDGPGLLEAADEHFLHVGAVAAAEHGGGLVDHAAEAVLELHHLAEGLLHDGGEGEEAEGVAGRGRVEDDDVVVEALDLLHQLREGHGLVDSRDGVGQLGHDGGDGGIVPAVGAGRLLHGLLHLLHVVVGVNLHGREVVEALDGGRLAADLLAEGIGEVVGGVGTDDEDLLAALGELDAEAARGGGLTDSALATNEDPLEGVLLDDVHERGIGKIAFVEFRHPGCVCKCMLRSY